MRQTKIAADDTLIFFNFLKKIRLEVLSESSAKQRIHMKSQVLFSLKKKKKKKKMKKYLWMSSAAVVIGAIRVNL